MAACGQVLTTCRGKWSGCPHGFPQQQFISSVLNSRLPNSLPLSGSVGSSSDRASASAHIAAAFRLFKQEKFSPSYQLLLSAIQFQHCCPSRAQHQGLQSRKKGTMKPHVWSTSTLSPRTGLQTSAVASGFVSPNGTSKSTRKEHVEQLEEFYSENEFLFADEIVGISGLDKEKLSLLLAAGRLQSASRVLVWGGSAAFAQELCVAISPASVIVAHFSMSVLGTIKEMNDEVICWLGDIEDLPDSYGPFDSVFLNSIVTTASSPAALLRGVASLCNPGARIVISFTPGRKDLAVCRDKNPQLVLQDLPDAADIMRIIDPLPLNLVDFQDETSFYIATFEVDGTSRGLNTENGSGAVSGQQKFPIPARGKVVEGFGRGSKQMGIPTANINPDELPKEFLELPKGVYFGWAQQGGTDKLDGGIYKMVMNIGNRPTFADGEGVTVEVHISHKFSSDFYGKELSVIVLGFIRAEMQFNSLGDLVKRIKADITIAENLLDQNEMLQYASDVFFARSF